MRTSAFSIIKGYLRTANQWVFKTPERALDEAYKAAVAIKAIEDSHFGGGKISLDYGNYSRSVHAYFQAELTKYLNIAKVRLTEFRISSTVFGISNNRQVTEIEVPDDSSEAYAINVIDKPALILRKLKFVDEMIARYGIPAVSNSSVVVLSESAQIQAPPPNLPENSAVSNNNNKRKNSHRDRARSSSEDIESIVDKTGVLPRSILKTVDRIKRELDPTAEEEVVENFRNSKARTVISLRLVLLLIIVPLLTQQISKNFLIGPIIDTVRSHEQVDVFLNIDMEEEAFTSLRRYEERLRFETLIGRSTADEAEIRTAVRERAVELEQEFEQRSNDAIKNVFADGLSAVAFAVVILNSRREIEVLKSFIDELIYGLSDSAKAFIIILFTDIFVGFHSPHGWEVLLEGVSRHLGLPENRDFIFLFIATFPVILDTIFKYWIFRYLNRISPSAVATYRNMNE